MVCAFALTREMQTAHIRSQRLLENILHSVGSACLPWNALPRQMILLFLVKKKNLIL